MSWMDIADEIWRIRPWTVVVLAAIYFLPLIRLVTFPLELGGRIFMRLNCVFGKYEHLIWPLRDYLAAPYLAIGAIWYTINGVQARRWEQVLVAFIAISLIALGLTMRIWRRNAHLSLIDFVRSCPTIHPAEFLDHLMCSSGIVRHKLPTAPYSTINPVEIDFRKPSRKTITLWDMIRGVSFTIWLTKLSLMAFRQKGAQFMREVASSLAVIWGTRISQLAKARVTIEGKERLPARRGAQIFLLTHMSFLDFALAPLLLAAQPSDATQVGDHGGRTPNCLPLFLIAKDHFRDNILFYRILGIGRVAKALQMIFVDRRSNDKVESARRVATDAASQLVSDGTPLAIFPQGTRAHPYQGQMGERYDAAYYTVGSRERIKADGKHLKTGAAHIATMTAKLLASRGETRQVELIPVAISGTAIACPRGSMRIAPNVHMRLKVGDPIIIEPAQVKGLTDSGDEYRKFVDQIHARIDRALKSAGRVHAELERRFFEDMRRMREPAQIEEISIAMKEWRGEDYLVHAILDAIYSCRPNRWLPFIGELTHLILNFATREELLVFKGKVANAVPDCYRA